jgi:hypothetical protein
VKEYRYSFRCGFHHHGGTGERHRRTSFGWSTFSSMGCGIGVPNAGRIKKDYFDKIIIPISTQVDIRRSLADIPALEFNFYFVPGSGPANGKANLLKGYLSSSAPWQQFRETTFPAHLGTFIYQDRPLAPARC